MTKPVHFKTGFDYTNVYFLVVDAKGHSGIVLNNDANRVDEAFDEFETIVQSAIDRKRGQKKCELAEFWGWQGDGGLCIIHDADESIARETALTGATEILAEIPGLNARVKRNGIVGEFHVRIAIHKGSFRYQGDDRRGSIHSKDLNLVSHLQQVVPSDTLAITEDVYKISGSTQNQFFEVGLFEDKKVYLQSNSRDVAKDDWRKNMQGVLGKSVELGTDVPTNELGLLGVYSQRAITEEYVKVIANAKECIWVLGIGLGGFQSDHHETLLRRKALEGVDIRFLVADPEVSIKIDTQTYSLPSWRDYDLGGGDASITNINNLTKMVTTINGQLKGSSGASPIHLKFARSAPSIALMRVDSIMYLSPYFVRQPSLKTFLFKLASGGRLYAQCKRHFESIWEDRRYSREFTTP